MNEVTRIHIAKTAYDIEVAAKKELEKYIKSLEVYTQDADVLADIEIRITELLAEQGVKAGGVISSNDVAAVRKQLGEPYEFAGDNSDIAVGPDQVVSGRRFYRSTDDAVLGGVLSGMAAYFGVNPLWTRLVFVLLLFISFGFVVVAYILFWILTPPARTVTEKLRLAGKDVTVESIKGLSAEEETTQPNKIAPILQRILTVGLGTISLLAAVGTLIFTIWLAVSAMVSTEEFVDITNGFTGLGDGNAWIAWLVFGIVLFGLALLTALFGLIAYGFFAKKLTKRMVVSGIIIMVLGLASVAATLGISSTQSFRVANETQSMMRETKANLPEEFANVSSVTFTIDKEKSKDDQGFFTVYPQIQYIVDEGAPRYELSALPTAKAITAINGTEATIVVSVPESFRNSFVQPTLAVYGPALDTISGEGVRVDYSGVTQDSLKVVSINNGNLQISGSYEKVEVAGSGFVNLGSSAIQSLIVVSDQQLSVEAGTVKNLSVSHPGVCASGTNRYDTRVVVDAVTSEKMTYNGGVMPATSHETNCAMVEISSSEEGNSY